VGFSLKFAFWCLFSILVVFDFDEQGGRGVGEMLVKV